MAGRAWKVWPRARRAGAPRGSVDKDCASRARPRGAGNGHCGGHTAHWSPESPDRRVRRAALDLLRPWGPHGVWMRLLCSASSSLPVFKRTRWRVHTWNAATLLRPTTVLDSASCESSRTAAHSEGPPRPRISLDERVEGLRSQCTQAETFSNRRGLWMEGCRQARCVPGSPLKVMEKGRFQDRAGSRQQARSGARAYGCNSGPWDRLS